MTRDATRIHFDDVVMQCREHGGQTVDSVFRSREEMEKIQETQSFTFFKALNSVAYSIDVFHPGTSTSKD